MSHTCGYALYSTLLLWCFFFFQAEDGIRDKLVTGVQTCALPIYADRVELLDAVEDQNADPHGSGVSVVWLNRSAPNGASVGPGSSSQNTSMSPWTSSPCSVMLYGFTDRGCFNRRILITCMTSCTSPFSRSLKRSPMTPSDTYSTRPSREDRGLSSFTSAVKMHVASVDLSCLQRANSFSRRSLSSAKSMFNKLTESIATRDAPLRLMKSGSSDRIRVTVVFASAGSN